MRLNAELPKEFWAEVVHMAVYLINRSPNLALDGKVVECWIIVYFWTSLPLQMRGQSLTQNPRDASFWVMEIE